MTKCICPRLFSRGPGGNSFRDSSGLFDPFASIVYSFDVSVPKIFSLEKLSTSGTDMKTAPWPWAVVFWSTGLSMLSIQVPFEILGHAKGPGAASLLTHISVVVRPPVPSSKQEARCQISLQNARIKR